MNTFQNKYSKLYLSPTKNKESQYKRLEKLVLSYNKNLKDEVIRAKDKFNLKARFVIADKTGLSLTHRTKVNDTKQINNLEKIPINVVDHVPLSIINLFEKYDDNHIELLLHYKRMKRSASELDFQIQKYNEFAQFHKESTKITELNNTKDHLHKLIKEVEDCGILEAIHKLGPDFLGAYFLNDKRVELYWLCIGLCNILYEKPIEDFTLVVLIHELVHGYTHIGFDKDGNNWNTDNLKSADLKIVEGFAQFYTEMLCRDYFGQATEAFKALLTNQSEEYTDYRNWFDDNELNKYEKIRIILLKTRKNGIKKYDEFMKVLNDIKKFFNDSAFDSTFKNHTIQSFNQNF